MDRNTRDALAPLFESIEIDSTTLALWRLGHPWGIAFPGTNGASLHAVTAGSAYFELGDGTTFVLQPGDVLLMTRFLPGTMRSRPGVPLVPLERIWAEHHFNRWQPGLTSPAPNVLEYGGRGTRTLIMGVLFDVAEPWRTNLLARLPSHLHFKRGQSVLARWLASALSAIVEENVRLPLGYGPIARRIAEIVLFSCIRSYLAGTRREDLHWLSALTNRHISRALSVMRTAPDRHWTVGGLAREAGMSRSTFAARFREVIGISPMKYLRDLRMKQAANALALGQVTVKQAARAAGYAYAGAFRMAFKRRYGVLPRCHRTN